MADTNQTNSISSDNSSTQSANTGPQQVSQQPNKPEEKAGSQKGLLIGLAVIAVVALILAGFFFVSAKSTKDQAMQQQESVEQAGQELQEQVAQAEKEQAEKEAEMARQQAELQAALESANNAISDLNDKLESESSTKVQQCETLLVTMPSDKVVEFRSSNWEKDIVKYYKDLETEQKTYDPGSEEWENIGLQKRVTEPYSNNFMANCEDIYDEDNSAIVANTAPATTPASTPTQ